MFSANSNQRDRRPDIQTFAPEARPERTENSRLRTLAQRIPRLNAVPTSLAELRNGLEPRANGQELRTNGQELRANNVEPRSNIPEFRTSGMEFRTNSSDIRLVQNPNADRLITSSLDMRVLPTPDFGPNSTTNGTTDRSFTEYRPVDLSTSNGIAFRNLQTASNSDSRTAPTASEFRIVPWSERNRTSNWDRDFLLRLPIVDLSRMRNSTNVNDSTIQSQDDTVEDYN